MGNCFSVTDENKQGNATSDKGIFTTSRPEHEILSSPNLKAFTYSDLRSATRNFRPDCLIGEGGFGYIYKGWIDEQTLMPTEHESGMVIAVKKLKPGSYQGHEEWLAEVDYLSQLQHGNLVRLIGFCIEGEIRLLVYEYMAKGSLENNLFTRRGFDLSWERRVKIATDAARGLAFLHSSEQPVIFRDFKTANILLDSEYNAKLSDFGIARVGPASDRSHVSTRIIGTPGYLAPEYLETGHLTTKCDVYSFGVVLFELLTGRRAIEATKFGRERSVISWVQLYLGDMRRVSAMMDIRLRGQYPKKAAYILSLLAGDCVAEPQDRPEMVTVLQSLELLSTVDSSTQSSQHSSPQQNSPTTNLYDRKFPFPEHDVATTPMTKSLRATPPIQPHRSDPVVKSPLGQ